MAEDIVCPKCGSLTPDARFCKHCGEALHTCISCGAKISKDAQFCTECGIQVKPAETAVEAGPKAYARYGPSLIPRDILIEGEEPLFETRPVLWLQLMPPIVFIIVGIAILVAVYFHFHITEILYGCAGFFLLGALWGLMSWWDWRHTVFAATNRRVLRETGILRKSYVDCPLRSVQTIHLDVSLWGRINRFGTVRISGGGVEIDWESIDEPREAHRILNEIVEQYRRQPG
jgi:membrane protein YdbS with pleckstrin-like domain/ribosomal protein L40E